MITFLKKRKLNPLVARSSKGQWGLSVDHFKKIIIIRPSVAVADKSGKGREDLFAAGIVRSSPRWLGLASLHWIW